MAKTNKAAVADSRTRRLSSASCGGGGGEGGGAATGGVGWGGKEKNREIRRAEKKSAARSVLCDVSKCEAGGGPALTDYRSVPSRRRREFHRRERERERGGRCATAAMLDEEGRRAPFPLLADSQLSLSLSPFVHQARRRSASVLYIVSII